MSEPPAAFSGNGPQGPAGPAPVGGVEALQAVADLCEQPLLILDRRIRVLASNALFCELLKARALAPGLELTAALPELLGSSLLASIEAAGVLESGELSIEAAPSTRMLAGRIRVLPWCIIVALSDAQAARLHEIEQWETIDGIAHAFQTPLTSLAGYSETLLRELPQASEIHRGFIERIHQQSLRLAKVVDDLLFMSRMQSGQSSLDLQPVDLRMPVIEALQRCIAQAEERGQGINLTLPEDNLLVHAHMDSLYDAVCNLLDNAIKYTPYAGEITITLQVEDGQAVLRVKDSGIGIEADCMAQLFTRFYRTDAARKSGSAGTGLGLAKVKSICDAHAGSIEVTSSSGVGSEFKLCLPLAEG